jgi:deoxyribodipyrimidine photo-lyase
MIDWAAGLRQVWTPGEEGARAQLQYALDEVLRDYPERRDRPDVIGTSRLSPHLHCGEIGPRQIWHAVEAYAARHVQRGVFQAASAYRRQLYWREFTYHLLWHFPHTADQPLRSEFAAFPWRDDAAGLGLWQWGQTGYPLVDAGMRQQFASLGWQWTAGSGADAAPFFRIFNPVAQGKNPIHRGYAFVAGCQNCSTYPQPGSTNRGRRQPQC